MKASTWLTGVAADVARGIDRHVDLSASLDLTLDLLNGTRDWRERLVEEFVFGAGTHARVRSSYQVLISEERLAPFATVADLRSAMLVLPLATRPKAPLFDLDLRGPGDTPPELVPRSATAAIQAAQLVRLLDASPSGSAMSPGLPPDLLTAICVFTPGRFLEVAKEYSYSRPLAVAQYLYDGLGLSERPSAFQVGEWLAVLESAAQRLADALDERRDRNSSSENVLLALADMARPPESVQGIGALVARFSSSVLAGMAAGDETFLSTLAEYGRRYEVLVSARMPIGERCTVAMVESRPLNLRRGSATQRFALGDARSGHMEVRVSDANVALGRFHVHALNGEAVGLGRLDSARKTSETLSLYGSDPDRPYYVDVSIRLRLAFFIPLGTALLLVLSLGALFAALEVPKDPLYVERLALLVIPTTLAAAVVLAREQSSLANQLQRGWRLMVALAIAALWTVVFAELLGFHDPPAPTPSAALVKMTDSS